jgi:hypothetical protein
MKVNQNKVVEELIELRYKKGYSATSLVEYLKDKYGIKQSRAYELIRQSQAKAGEIYNEVNTDVIKQSILFMENLRQEALKQGNIKQSLEIQKELNKVNQLYIEKQEIKLTGQISIKDLLDFDDDKDESNS